MRQCDSGCSMLGCVLCGGLLSHLFKGANAGRFLLQRTHLGERESGGGGIGEEW